MMKTLMAAMAAAVAVSSPAAAVDAVRDAGTPVAETAAYRAPMGTTLSIIVRPNGGGIEADPDIGMPAMTPVDPGVPAATDRH